MTRVLKPGGQLLVLEFSHPTAPGLKPIYDAYSFSILPRLGKYVARDEAAYRYLAESIRMHPDQDTLKRMMADAGLERVEYFNLAAGVVALHNGNGTEAVRRLSSFDFGSRAVEEYRLYYLANGHQLTQNIPGARQTLAQLWRRSPP